MNVGPPPAARALDRLARRLVHREHVEPVDANAGDPVADRLVGERRGTRLRRERRRDRPAVVVADEARPARPHRGEVDALVERALARRAVAEERHRDRRLAAQLLPPREPGGVRDLRRDRHDDRADVPVGRVPPARRVAAPPLQDRLGGHARGRARWPTRGSSGRSSRRRAARTSRPPGSPRGSRRSRRCRCGPGAGRRPRARRRCAAAPAGGTARGGRLPSESGTRRRRGRGGARASAPSQRGLSTLDSTESRRARPRTPPARRRRGLRRRPAAAAAGRSAPRSGRGRARSRRRRRRAGRAA